MADIQSNISVNIDTSGALASLKALQGQISAFHQQMSKSGALAASEMSKMQNSLMNGINRSGQFDARLKTIKTTTESFTEALEKNKLSMGEYFRYAGAATKDFGKLFGKEFDTIEKVARERVKDLQTQYIKMGRDANGAMKAISIRPLTLDLDDASTKMQIAAQRQQILNQVLKQGSTQMLNWGKNTQWAGRQLMVGFTVPLTMLGQIAGKTFMQMEEQVIKFQRVYGDFSTTTQQTKEMTTEVTNLAKAFTKYGVSVSDTMGMAADAAAMGKVGADLLAQVQSATELSVLGGIDQKQALETTISLTNAFGIATDQLKSKINFLNVVENQTVTSIEDLTIAIPKAAPVIKQLGGNVEDLAFFLTAMKEGGIDAAEGANALKSGIASIINPTKKASDMLSGFGINIKGIVEANKGDVKGMVMGVAEALNTLDPLKRAQAIEQLFGKFQFARISTLFKNITDVNSQATKVAALAAQGPEASAILAQRELKKIEESPMFKFKKALEDLKTELVPLGEQFLKIVTPIAEFVKKALEGFNNLSDGVKGVVGNIALWLGGIGPIAIMTIGLIANGVANMIKIFATIKGFLNGVGKGTQDLGSQTSYMTSKQVEAAAVAASLDQVHSKLRQTFTAEAGAVANLTTQLEKAVAAQKQFGWTPGAMPGAAGKGRKKFAAGGMVVGPGGPKDDLVPTDLSNGEAVIDAATVKKNPRIIGALFAGKKINIPGYASNNRGAFRSSGPVTADTPSQYENVFAHIADPIAMTLEDFVKKLKAAGQAIPADIQRKLDAGFEKASVRTYGGLGFETRQSYNDAMKPGRAGVVPKDFIKDFEDRGLDKWKTSLKVAGINLSDVSDELGQLDKSIVDQIKNAQKLDKNFVVTDKAIADFTEVALKPLREKGSQLAAGFDKAKKTVTEVRGNTTQAIASAAGYRAEPGRPGYYINDKYSEGDKDYRVNTGRLVKIGGGAKGKTSRGVLGGATMDDFTVEGIKESTDQRSPSRKAKKAGEMIGIGALQGIGEVAKKAGTQAQKDSIALASATKAAYAKDSILRNLTIQKKQAEMMGANTASIEQEIAARRKAIAAEIKNAAAVDTATNATKSQGFTGSAPLPAGYQGPIGPNDKRKGNGLGSRILGGIKGVGGKIMGGGVASGMGLGMAGMAVGMIPGMEGVGSAISMAGMIPSLLPMLANPIGATVAALGLLTVGIIALNAANEENKRKQIALGNASVMSADKMIKVSKDLGTVTATEARRSSQTASIAGISEKDMGQAASYLETDSGKAMLADIKTQKEGGKTDSEIANSTVNNLANLVSQGAMSKEIASGILTAMGQKTGNFALTASTSQLQNLTSGKTTDVGASTVKGVKESYGNLEPTTVSTYRGEFSTLPTMMPKLREGAVATSNAYAQIVGQADILNQKLKSNQITQEEYNVEITENKKQQKEVSDQILKIKNTMGASEWNDTFTKNIKESFGEDSEAAKTADKINALGDSDFKTNMQINLESGALTPDVVNKFIEMQTADANFGKMYTASVAVNGQTETDNLVIAMLVAGKDQAQIDAVLKVASDNPEAMSIINTFTSRAGTLGISLGDIDLTNLDKLKLINDEYTKIADMTKNGPITLEMVTKTAGFEGFKANAEWFNGLPKEQQAWAMQYYITVKDTITGDDINAYIKAHSLGGSEAFANSSTGQMILADQGTRDSAASAIASQRTRTALNAQVSSGAFNTGGSSGGGGGGSTAPTKSDKISAALSIIGRKEDKINKAYDERLKALDKIQAANDKINQQKKDQLDIADALSKGDIGAAARAQQQARETAQANALQEQRDRMTAARDAQIKGLKVNGMTRDQMEAWQRSQENTADNKTLGSFHLATGGMVPNTQYLALGGKPKGTDTIAAMLTPGEFVVKKSAVNKIGSGNMSKINRGELPTNAGGSVYNYSINVSVKSDADPDKIANVVMTKIKNIENQGMKGDKA
jgi:TP901 family phage tail tape measure protein